MVFVIRGVIIYQINLGNFFTQDWCFSIDYILQFVLHNTGISNEIGLVIRLTSFIFHHMLLFYFHFYKMPKIDRLCYYA